jgi:hypothetical protein
MAINATNTGGKVIPPMNAGTYSARCYSMVHIGTIDEQIQGKPIQWINKVQLTFEVPSEKFVFDETKGEESRVVGKEFTLSMNEKAKLRKFLESWRGAVFTEDQAKSFDVTKLLNVPCLVNIIHKTSAKGNIYTEIATVTSPVAGMVVPELTNKLFEFNFNDKLECFPDVPKFIREKIVRSKEWNAIEPATRARLIANADAKSNANKPATTTTPPATVQTATGATVANSLPF